MDGARARRFTAAAILCCSAENISSARIVFYEANGGKTIILARFVPIVRTFCPPVAGAARMSYPRYLLFDILGGVLWVWGMVLLGYTLGVSVPNVDKKIHYVIAGVIVASFLPMAYHWLKSRWARGKSEA